MIIIEHILAAIGIAVVVGFSGMYLVPQYFAWRHEDRDEAERRIIQNLKPLSSAWSNFDADHTALIQRDKRRRAR